jgi:hypothetical protein
MTDVDAPQSDAGLQQEVIAFLGSSVAHDGLPVTRVDTHSACVFIAGPRAWKLKRAVRYDYLDFSTPELRRAACEREVRLNAPAAPGIYRGVVPVVRRPGGELAIGEPGEPVDWLVAMNRFDCSAAIPPTAPPRCTETTLLPAPLRAFAGTLAGAVPVAPAFKAGADDKLRRFLRAVALPTREAHFTWGGGWVPRDAAAILRGAPARTAALAAIAGVAARVPDAPSLRDLQQADLAEYLPNDILAKVDRSTMAHGLESRAPFLDRQLAAFALGLPDRLKTIGRANTKVLLRRLVARHFGDDHARAPKQGFSVPLHHWLRTSGRDVMHKVLDRDRVRALGVIDEAAVHRAVGDHASGRRTIGPELWGLMVLVCWFEQRVASPPSLAARDTSDLQALAFPPPGA